MLNWFNLFHHNSYCTKNITRQTTNVFNNLTTNVLIIAKAYFVRSFAMYIGHKMYVHKSEYKIGIFKILKGKIVCLIKTHIKKTNMLAGMWLEIFKFKFKFYTKLQYIFSVFQ